MNDHLRPDNGFLFSRADRRAAAALERAAIKTGDWGPWQRVTLPQGIPGTGWCKQIRFAYRNQLYAVLVRPVHTGWGVVQHLAICTVSSIEPPWRDKQRIKNELFGADRVAVEVMPPAARLVDQADMYHVWVLPPGHLLPFGLSDEERAHG
ncbi:DUF7694 domain-containing protein [Chelatococcus reniformis]|uniref:DUF7694 domain-containing protein n=1 Tax=Chelatococcus reniformis TaxID=1494448 RepID=A0A916XFN0_9HYPH|nr:hypothetical protein [Chelatococcus reniformis]GGC68410.1 hypothetical protein GCM10010994_28720 [Chelatococcus reniformis]